MTISWREGGQDIVAIFPFKCRECGVAWEEDQSLRLDVHESKCPECGSMQGRAFVALNIYKQFHEGEDVGAGEYFGSQGQKDEFLAKEADKPGGLTPLYSQTRSRPAGKAGRIKKNYGHIG